MISAAVAYYGAEKRSYTVRRRYEPANFTAMTDPARLSDTEFKDMFKLTREQFAAVLLRIEPQVKRDATKQKNASGVVIPPDVMLAVTLRWLSGGSRYDIQFAFGNQNRRGFSKSHFYLMVWTVIDAILNEWYDDMLCFKELRDVDALKKLAAGFDRLTRDTAIGCVGALDGLAVRIAGPNATECPNPRTYFNRKGFFSVNMQALCDSNKCFTYASIQTAGSTHDATAWGCCGLSLTLDKLEEHRLWIVADDAYPPSEYLITPYQGANSIQADTDFNYYQSRLRINIECAFGMLIRR